MGHLKRGRQDTKFGEGGTVGWENRCRSGRRYGEERGVNMIKIHERDSLVFNSRAINQKDKMHCTHMGNSQKVNEDIYNVCMHVYLYAYMYRHIYIYMPKHIICDDIALGVMAQA